MPDLDDRETPSVRGINGSIQTNGSRTLDLCLELLNGGLAKGQLRSTELKGSQAPLLISLHAQKALGLVIDLAAEVVHSQALGADLKLVVKDGLLGLRLLPADDLRDEAEHEQEDDDSEHTASENDTGLDDYDTQEALQGVAESCNGHGKEDQLPTTKAECSYFAIDEVKKRTMKRGQGSSSSRTLLVLPTWIATFGISCPGTDDLDNFDLVGDMGSYHEVVAPSCWRSSLVLRFSLTWPRLSTTFPCPIPSIFAAGQE